MVYRSTGGTSGALYDIFFSAAAASVKEGEDRQMSTSQPATWVIALEAGNAAMMKYGGAKAGDRTMLDALLPAAKGAREMISKDAASDRAAAEAAAAEAMKGAAATCELTAGAGRSSYVPVEVLKTVPDPGATAAAAWIGAIALSLGSSSS